VINWDAEVLAPLMDAGVFGEAVQPNYRPSGGGAFDIDGVFDNAFLADTLISADGIPEFQTVAPTLGVRLSQFQSYPQGGDKVFVPSVGKTYFVSEVRPDGKGWARLILTLSSE
jgi:hypothetical protein